MGRWWRGLSRLRGALWQRRIYGKPGRERPGDSKPAGEQPAAERAAGAEADDHETAELTAAYWRAYDQRLATVKFSDVARQFPALIRQAVSLGWSASRRDTAATIGLNLASGAFGGFALFATTGVLEALFAAGPTPDRVRAALPSLLLVAASTAIRPVRCVAIVPRRGAFSCLARRRVRQVKGRVGGRASPRAVMCRTSTQSHPIRPDTR